MELIITLHGKHAATLDVADDRWLHAANTSMGPMSGRISAAWSETPATRQLDCWLDGCLPENGLLGRYRARAQAMLQAAGVARETPKVGEILRANADAEFAGAIRFDTERTRNAAQASGYERLTERDIGRRLDEADRIARGLGRGTKLADGPQGIALSGMRAKIGLTMLDDGQLRRCMRSGAQYLDREGGGQPETARRGRNRSDLPASVRGARDRQRRHRVSGLRWRPDSAEPTLEGTGGIEGILPADQLSFDSHGTLEHEHCATPSCARRIATLAESTVRASNMGAIKGANEHTVMANLCPSTDADDAQAPAPSKAIAALGGGTLCKWMALSAEDLSAIAYMAPERDVLIGATLYELRQAPWAIRPQTR